MTRPWSAPRELSPVQRARLATALLAAERGWHVFPLEPGRKKPEPAFTGWEQHATADPGHIVGYWSRRPDCNVAVACGPSQLLVVDLDQPKPGRPAASGLGIGGIVRTGAEAFAQLARQAGAPIPDTYTVRTPSGGTHLYFRAPDAPRLRNTKGKLAALVDTRGHGGYVVAPGSTLPEGAYELIDDQDPAEMPGWLLQALTPKPATAVSEPSEVAPQRLGAYVTAALNAQVERVRKAPRGSHNHTLFVAACRLGELVGAGALDPTTATHMLQQAAAPIVASACDCTQREIDATIRSGLRNGASKPRRLPARPTRRAA